MQCFKVSNSENNVILYSDNQYEYLVKFNSTHSKNLKITKYNIGNIFLNIVTEEENISNKIKDLIKAIKNEEGNIKENTQIKELGTICDIFLLFDFKNEYAIFKNYVSPRTNSEKNIKISFLKELLNKIDILKNLCDTIYQTSNDLVPKVIANSSLNITEKIFLAINDYSKGKASFSLPSSTLAYMKIDKENILSLNSYLKENYPDGTSWKDRIKIVNSKKFKLFRIYNIQSIMELLDICLYNLIQSNQKINKCLNCGKYFIPKSKSNEKYCDRISPQNSKKTCKQYGVKKTYRDEIKLSDIMSEHNRTCQAYRMRLKRAKSVEEKSEQQALYNKYKNDFWNVNTQYRNELVSKSEIMQWQKDNKPKC